MAVPNFRTSPCRSGQYLRRGQLAIALPALSGYIWVCLKIGNTPKPNGFADHYPYEKWLFHWEYTLFSDKPIYIYIYIHIAIVYISYNYPNLSVFIPMLMLISTFNLNCTPKQTANFKQVASASKPCDGGVMRFPMRLAFVQILCTLYSTSSAMDVII